MSDVATHDAPPRRQRNPRGQGHRLRDEILAGATTILEHTGDEHAVTLRAIARHIGITAPSITAHFPDPAAIIDAVVAEQLSALAERLHSAAHSAADPVDALHAAWAAYLDFGRTNPAHYRVIFERRFLPVWDDQQRPMIETAPLFDATVEMMIGLLQTCIDTAHSTSTDAFADSVAVWYYTHGLVALPAAITSFAWPDAHAHLATGITNLAHLTPARQKRRPPTTTRR